MTGFEQQAAGDMLVFDGLRPATLRRTDGQAPVAVAHALRRAVRTAELPAGSGLAASDAYWHLPQTELPSPPRLGDQIVDAAETAWTVLAVDAQVFDGRWRCHARDLSIAAGLDQQVVIQRATWRQAPDGAPLAVWSDWRLHVPASIRPVGGKAVDLEARTQMQHRLRVFLAEPAVLDHNYRIVQGANVYRILGYEAPERLEQLTTLLVEPVD